MSKETIHIYINPTAELDTYPAELTGDMSVFRSARTIQHEVQWVFYLMLKDQGMDVRISREYPREGIFIIHKANARRFLWNPDLFVVSLQWDYKRDDRAQMHLVSNHYKTTKAALGWLDRFSFAGLQCYNPPVMHSVFTHRDPGCGDRFENIAFIGDPKNLDDEFKTEAFLNEVKALGMRFIVIEDPQKLSDLSDVDVVLAIRKFGQVINNKPPVKLINAWRGHVPAILGCEVGYREAWQNEYDYIEVDSMEETLAALKRLKDDVDYRNRMIANAKERAIPFSAQGQQEAWVRFFKEKVLPANAKWQRRSLIGKSIFLVVRWIRSVMRYSLSFIWRHILRRDFRDYSSKSAT